MAAESGKRAMLSLWMESVVVHPWGLLAFFFYIYYCVPQDLRPYVAL